MAEVWRHRGEYPSSDHNIEAVFAYAAETRLALKENADEIEARAKRLLAQRRNEEGRSEGHTTITHETGDLDHFIGLSDERGLEAAWVIEFGRRGTISMDDDGQLHESAGQEGKFIITDASLQGASGFSFKNKGGSPRAGGGKVRR